jgi:hypothetical protein
MELADHVVAVAEDDVVVDVVAASRRRVVAVSGDGTCWPTRGLSDSGPAICSALRARPGHRRCRAAVDGALYQCWTGYSRALERGRPRSEMRMGYVRWPSTRGSRGAVAVRCGGERDIQPRSQSPCREGRTCSTIIILTYGVVERGYSKTTADSIFPALIVLLQICSPYRPIPDQCLAICRVPPPSSSFVFARPPDLPAATRDHTCLVLIVTCLTNALSNITYPEVPHCL